jgi:ribosomal protein S18 acetylase RimI-like enzyme
MWEISGEHRLAGVIAYLKHYEYLVGNEISRCSLGVDGLVALCQQRGGVVLNWHANEISGVALYTLGVPSEGFPDPSIAYILLMILSPEDRFGRFLKGLLFVLREIQRRGAVVVRFKSRQENEYERRLYQKFSRIVATEDNLAGHPSFVFQCPVSEALQRLGCYERHFRS